MSLRITDLVVGNTYRLLDRGSATFGGCDIEVGAVFTVLDVEPDDTVFVNGEGITYDGESGNWYIAELGNANDLTALYTLVSN